MKVRIIMEITGDDGEEIGREIIADMTKITTGAEDSACRSPRAKPCLPGFSRRWWRRRWTYG